MVSSKSCLDLSADHSPIIVTLSHQSQYCQSSPFLCNKHTNWTQFKISICENLDIKRSLKTVTEVEDAIEHFNTTVQQAAWSSTWKKTQPIAEAVKLKLKEKRKIRKRWQTTRDPQINKQLNRAAKDLKSILSEIENKEVQTYYKIFRQQIHLIIRCGKQQNQYIAKHHSRQP